MRSVPPTCAPARWYGVVPAWCRAHPVWTHPAPPAIARAGRGWAHRCTTAAGAGPGNARRGARRARCAPPRRCRYRWCPGSARPSWRRRTTRSGGIRAAMPGRARCAARSPRRRRTPRRSRRRRSVRRGSPSPPWRCAALPRDAAGARAARCRRGPSATGTHPDSAHTRPGSAATSAPALAAVVRSGGSGASVPATRIRPRQRTRAQAWPAGGWRQSLPTRGASSVPTRGQSGSDA